MNISQLRTFLMVVEHSSFSAAARSMRLSQPAVTMQIQSLEADLGATLLDRKYRSVELTEAGRLLLPHAREIVEQVNAARDRIAALSDTVTGRLLLSASTTPGQYILPRIVGGFLRDNPEVTIAIAVHDTAEVVEAVESGEAHLGMVGAHVPGARAGFDELGSDDLVMIAPPGHPLSLEIAPTTEEIAQAKFIMREEGSGTRQVTESVLRSAGIEPEDLDVVTEMGTSEAIVSAVEGGMGVGVVSAWVADKALRVGSIATVKWTHFPMKRPLYLVTSRRTPTRAAEAFVRYIQAHDAELKGPLTSVLDTGSGGGAG